MKVSIPSGRLIIGDPCYIKAEHIPLMAAGEAFDDDVYELQVPTEARIEYEEADGRVMKVSLIFDDNEMPESECIGELGVDTAQLFFADAEHFAKNWIDEEYQDIRIYRNKEDGRTLQYRKDFPHYGVPIASEGGKTMNDLNATGEWEPVQVEKGELKVSYNGLCHCHDHGVGKLDDHIAVTSTGWGDGAYELHKHMTPDGRIARLSLNFGEMWEEDEEEWEEEGGDEEE